MPIQLLCEQVWYAFINMQDSTNARNIHTCTTFAMQDILSACMYIIYVEYAYKYFSMRDMPTAVCPSVG